MQGSVFIARSDWRLDQFLAAALITDQTASLSPIRLGEGFRLFGPTGADRALQLPGNRAFDAGLVQLQYALPGVDAG